MHEIEYLLKPPLQEDPSKIHSGLYYILDGPTEVGKQLF